VVYQSALPYGAPFHPEMGLAREAGEISFDFRCNAYKNHFIKKKILIIV
jgi:hypothetical protein